MKQYECVNCGRIHTWQEWGQLASDPGSGVILLNIIPGYTINDMEIRCSCGKGNRFFRYLICRECRHGKLVSSLASGNDIYAYKCVLGKSPNGKCWEE